MSRDSVKSHVNFATKMELTYPLLSDPETELLQGLGAWGSKKVKGEVKWGPVRSTVVTDADGKVLQAYFKVKAKGHAEGVLEDLS